MLQVVVDTSVLVKWFDANDGDEVIESRLVHAAHRDGLLTAHILDLTLYEFGNVLIRSKKWPAERAADGLDALHVICGPPLVPTPTWRRDAAHLAAEHRLSYYDACFAAAAQSLGATLLSTDRKLVEASLAQQPSQFVREHGDHIRKTP